jgi:hypothetical protein
MPRWPVDGIDRIDGIDGIERLPRPLVAIGEV